MTRGTCATCKRRIGALPPALTRARWHRKGPATCPGVGLELLELAEEPPRIKRGRRGRPRKELPAEAVHLVRRWLSEGFSKEAAARGVALRGLAGDLRPTTVLERVTEISWEMYPGDRRRVANA